MPTPLIENFIKWRIELTRPFWPDRGTRNFKKCRFWKYRDHTGRPYKETPNYKQRSFKQYCPYRWSLKILGIITVAFARIWIACRVRQRSTIFCFANTLRTLALISFPFKQKSIHLATSIRFDFNTKRCGVNYLPVIPALGCFFLMTNRLSEVRL